MRFIPPRSAALALLAFGTVGLPAFAGTLLQEGTAQPAAPLGTYGMQAPVPLALHTILPKGWNLVIAQGLDLPGKVSWAPTDTWLDTVARIADRTDAGFLVDWNRHQLAIRSVSETSRAVSTLEQARQQATDPLPPLTPKHAAPAAAAAPAASTPVPPVGPSATVTPKPVVAAVDRPAVPAIPASSLTADPARSFYSESIGDVLGVLASHYQLTLRFAGPDVPLPGPVTLQLRDNLAADVERLQRALGALAPLAITSYTTTHELVVERAPNASYTALEAPAVTASRPGLFARLTGSRASHAEPVATDSRTASAVRVSAPLPAVVPAPNIPSPSLPTVPVAPVAASAAVPSPATPAVAATAPMVTPTVPAATAPLLAFDIAAGERLSAALERFVRAQGYQLAWRSPDDQQADESTHLTGTTLTDVLNQLLPALGLTHSIDGAKHLITVTSATVAGTP